MYKHILVLFLFFSQLEAGVVRLYDEAAETRIGMKQLRRGMGKEDVLYILGYPYQVEKCCIDGKDFEVWYYVYRKPSLSQRAIVRRNLTPVVFYQNRLTGWGDDYFKHLNDHDNAQDRKAHDDSRKYSDDEDEWPAKDHRIVPKPKTQDDQEKPLLKAPQGGTLIDTPENEPDDKSPDAQDGPGDMYIFTDIPPDTRKE